MRITKNPSEVDRFRVDLYALLQIGMDRSYFGISYMAYPDITLFSCWSARICILAATAFPVIAAAQQAAPQAEQQPQKSITAVQGEQPGVDTNSTGWNTQSSSDRAAAPAAPQNAETSFALTSEQSELLARINIYLNGLDNLEGRFVQTDPSSEQKRGLFYIKRPGRVRFDYASPSLMRIVSDGSYLSIEDHDLKTVDKFPLDATPIQLLLGEDIDLARDAIILDMWQEQNAVALVLKDRSGNSGGQIQIYFKRPEIQLYEWVVTDVQGLDTRMQLADLVSGIDKTTDFFKASDIELENVGNN